MPVKGEKNMEDNLEKETDTKDVAGEKNDAKKAYRKLELRLEGLQDKKKNKLPLRGGIVTAVLSSLLFYMYAIYSYTYTDIVVKIVFSGLVGLVVGLIFALETSICLDILENRVRREMLDYEMENVQNKVGEDVFENSIKMSYKYLDQYYHQTREQAQKGFFVTVCISVFGAILIGAGIVAMFMGEVKPSYITCASGVVTEFISAIFFYLYNKTVTSMSKYHNKLVLSQNISIALKVADTLPDSDKTKAKNTIINELLKDVNSYLTKSDQEIKSSTDKKDTTG